MVKKTRHSVKRTLQVKQTLQCARAIGSSLAVLALIAGCDGGTDPPVASSVSVSPASVELAALGETQQLGATVLDRDGQPIPDAPVTWASTDASVVTVSTAGLVTAAGNGSARVTAISGSAEGAAAVTVAQVLVLFEVSPTADTLVSLGETVQLATRSLDDNGNAIPGIRVEWSSADESVATVDADGLVTAVSNGNAAITASGGGSAATAAVTVAQRAARVEVTPSADTLVALGDSLRITAATFDGNGHAIQDARTGWSSTDAAVATVDSTGLVIAAGNGSASITATVGDASAATEVTVSQVLVGVGIVPANTTFFSLGDTVRLVAAGRDANGHAIAGLSFTWTSEDPTVATVDANGLVTAVRTGGTDIFAASGELSISAGVVVTQLASEVRVTPAADTLDVGETVLLTAMAVDRNGYEVEDTDYIWHAPHPSVATVDRNGLVTAVGAGTGEIRVRATRGGADRIGVATITVRGMASGGR